MQPFRYKISTIMYEMKLIDFRFLDLAHSNSVQAAKPIVPIYAHHPALLIR